MRRISYRAAITGLFFAACWLVVGFLFLLTPIPHALGIGTELIQVWIVLFFIALGVSGAMLTMAAINGMFPPVVRAPARRPGSSKDSRGTSTDAPWSSATATTTRVSRPRER